MPERLSGNLRMLKKVAVALGDIAEEVVFVGGAVVELYGSQSGSEIRATKDVDISIQVSSYGEMEILRERLAAKGIFPASDSDVIYRYTLDGIWIDFIPIESSPLGPTNSWLKPGFKYAEQRSFGGVSIKILPATYFVATKWEAFKSRGSDPRWSHDFEDIVTVMANHANFLDEYHVTDPPIRHFLSEMAREISLNKHAREIIECQLEGDAALKKSQLILDWFKLMY